MRMRRLFALLIAVTLFHAVPGANAQDDARRRYTDSDQDSGGGGGGVALGLKIGTLGIGADLTAGLSEHLNLRGGANMINVRYSGVESDDVAYDADIQYTSLSLLLDWHPFANHFRISGGAFWNNDDNTLEAQFADSQSVGGGTYTPEQIGTITGTLDMAQIGPYLGIGYGNAVGTQGRLSFAFDIGVMFQDYEVTLTADGLLAQNPGFLDDLDEEASDLEDELNSLGIYPVLMFGIAYRF